MDILKDFKFGLRLCTKHLSSSILALIVLSVGIGIFGILFTASTKLLETGSGEELDERQLFIQWELGLANGGQVSVQDFNVLNEEVDSLENLIGIELARFDFSLASKKEEIKTYTGVITTPNLFDLTSEKPIRGRLFNQNDIGSNDVPRILISHLVWSDFFDRSEEAIGSISYLNGKPATIVGVMPKKFTFPRDQQIWVASDWREYRSVPRGKAPRINITGKIRPQFDLDHVRTELKGIAANLAAAYPETNENLTRFRLTPFRGQFLNTTAKVLLGIGIIASVLVLILACTNVFHTLMARTANRSHELAVRCSLGARRRHVVWQVLVDGITLSGIGAVIGIGIAAFGLRVITDQLSVFDIPGRFIFELKPNAIWVIIGTSLVAGAASSLIPAWRASKINSNDILKDDSKSSSGIHLGWLSKTLVISQVTFSTILLYVSVSFIFPNIFVRSIEMPYDQKNVLAANMNLRADPNFQDQNDVVRFYTELKEKLHSIPGIRSTGLVSSPWGMVPKIEGIEIENREITSEFKKSPGTVMLSQWTRASPDYLEVYGMSCISGRMFGRFDTNESMKVCVVNTRFVDAYFPNEIPIGKRVRTAKSKDESEWFTIVGVIPDTKPKVPALTPTEEEMTNKMFSEVVIPFTQGGIWNPSLIVYADNAESLQTSQAIRQTILDVAPKARIIGSLLTVEKRLSFLSRIIDIIYRGGITFGTAILLISVIGLYSVISFTTSQRRKEFGIRMAVGSGGWGIAKTVLKPWSISIGIGLILGGLVCLILIIVITSFGEYTSAVDTDFLGIAITFLPAALIICVASFAAVAIPAWRAIKISPMEVIRVE